MCHIYYIQHTIREAIIVNYCHVKIWLISSFSVFQFSAAASCQHFYEQEFIDSNTDSISLPQYFVGNIMEWWPFPPFFAIFFLSSFPFIQRCVLVIVVAVSLAMFNSLCWVFDSWIANILVTQWHTKWYVDYNYDRHFIHNMAQNEM